MAARTSVIICLVYCRALAGDYGDGLRQHGGMPLNTGCWTDLANLVTLAV